jgi:hypothetical protein
MLVVTFWENGGLNQIMFRDRDFNFVEARFFWKIIFSLYPLAAKALLYNGVALSKTSLLDEILLIRFDIMVGMVFIILGGWLELTLIYNG